MLRVVRCFVLPRLSFRDEAKYGRRSFHRIMGRWLWLNGMCCHHVCFVVSSNHKQTKGSLCRRDFGSVESGAIYMVIWWLARCFYRKRGFIWYLFMATTSIARFNLNGRKRGFSTWSIIRLGPRLICLFIKFTHKLVLHPIGLRAVNVCMGVIDSTMEGGLMESDGYLAGKIIILNGIRGKINHDCMVLMRFGCQELVLGYMSMMVMAVLEGVLWLFSMILWWLRCQGIFKPKLRSSREPINNLYNEST